MGKSHDIQVNPIDPPINVCILVLGCSLVTHSSLEKLANSLQKEKRKEKLANSLQKIKKGKEKLANSIQLFFFIPIRFN